MKERYNKIQVTTNQLVSEDESIGQQFWTLHWWLTHNTDQIILFAKHYFDFIESETDDESFQCF